MFKIPTPDYNFNPAQCNPTITSVPYENIRYPNPPPEEGVLIQQKQEKSTLLDSVNLQDSGLINTKNPFFADASQQLQISGVDEMTIKKINYYNQMENDGYNHSYRENLGRLMEMGFPDNKKNLQLLR